VKIWLEIHCDLGPRYSDMPGRCESDDNNNPAALANSAAEAMREASSGAIRARWIKDGSLWICPRCQRIRSQSKVTTKEQ
jgi:hypothetical protein